jgi:hypothetical protein
MRKFVFVLLTGLLLASVASAQTPVMFTTNDDVVAMYGPHRVQYITVFVDGVKKCYTESHGNCTSTPLLTPGLHKAEYVWATCNNPASCPSWYGVTTHYVLVPAQLTTFIVRIPTAKVKWNTKYGVNISLNAQWLGVALGGGTLTKNVMAGCYTASYKMGYSQPIPPWPVTPGVPDGSLKGFDGVCIGAHTTYPVPPTAADPHVVITLPTYPGW